MIIKECSDEIVQLEELIRKVIKKYPDVSSTTISSIISDLNKERLVYIDHYTKEVFCIIDSDTLDRML